MFKVSSQCFFKNNLQYFLSHRLLNFLRMLNANIGEWFIYRIYALIVELCIEIVNDKNMMMNKDHLYSVIYQDIQDAFAEIQQLTQDQHLCAIGLGMVEDFCGFFYVGCTLEQLKTFEDVYEAWWISEWELFKYCQ